MTEEINLDFVKPNKDCNTCDHHNFYTCFECEWIQVKDKYNNSFWSSCFNCSVFFNSELIK